MVTAAEPSGAGRASSPPVGRGSRRAVTFLGAALRPAPRAVAGSASFAHHAADSAERNQERQEGGEAFLAQPRAPAPLQNSDRDCGRRPSRCAIAHRSALELFPASSRSAVLRLVLRTRPRSHPLLPARARKNLTGFMRPRLDCMARLRTNAPRKPPGFADSHPTYRTAPGLRKCGCGTGY